MHDGVPVIRKHEDLLEVFSCTDLEFKNILFSLCGDLLEMTDGITDSNGRRVFVNAADLVAFLENVLGDPVHRLNQVVLSDASPVHQQDA